MYPVVTMSSGSVVTSEQLAHIYRRAENYWFRCPLKSKHYKEHRADGRNYRSHAFKTLRDRLPDGERMKWKERFCARAITLIPFWRRNHSS